ETVSSIALSRLASRGAGAGAAATAATGTAVAPAETTAGLPTAAAPADTTTGLPEAAARAPSPADFAEAAVEEEEDDADALVDSLVSLFSVPMGRSFQRGGATQDVSRGITTGDALVEMNLVHQNLAERALGPGRQRRGHVARAPRPSRSAPDGDVRAKLAAALLPDVADRQLLGDVDD